MSIRAANVNDIDRISEIYEKIHEKDEAGIVPVGWARNVYPTRQTAEDALDKGELFVAELDGKVVGSAIFNKLQLDCYKEVKWQYECDDNNVMVMHTLALDPDIFRRGVGQAFVDFYEKYALESGCDELRIDTQDINTVARSLYAKCGFNEVGIVPTVFNNIPDIMLVLLEKKLMK